MVFDWYTQLPSAQNSDGFCYRERFRSLYIRLCHDLVQGDQNLWSAVVAGAWRPSGRPKPGLPLLGSLGVHRATETWSAVAGACVHRGDRNLVCRYGRLGVPENAGQGSPSGRPMPGPSIRALLGASRPVVAGSRGDVLFGVPEISWLWLPSIRTSKTRPSRLAAVHILFITGGLPCMGLRISVWRAIRARLRQFIALLNEKTQNHGRCCAKNGKIAEYSAPCSSSRELIVFSLPGTSYICRLV